MVVSSFKENLTSVANCIYVRKEFPQERVNQLDHYICALKQKFWRQWQ